MCVRWFVATCDYKHVVALEAEPPRGLKFIRFGVWEKPDSAPQFTGDRPGMGWEAIAFLHRDDEPIRWNGGGRRGGFVHCLGGDRGLHPTQKPLSLIKEFVQLFTDPGDLILDPFAGSFTTARAAKDLGRRCVAIEISEKHCEAGARRMAQEVMFAGI